MNGMKAAMPILRLFFVEHRWMMLAGIALSSATVLAGIGLLGLSGWFITATAIAGVSVSTALAFDVFAPSAGIRLLALGRTFARYGERLTTHEATLRILASLRERLFRGWAAPGAAKRLAARPAKLLFRLTSDIDALDSLYLRIIVPAAGAIISAVVAGIALGLMHPLLGIGFACWILLCGLGLPVVAARLSHRAARRRAHAMEALRSRTIDFVAGKTELVMAGRLAAQRQSIMGADQRLALADDDLHRIETGVLSGLGVASAIALSGVLLAAALLVKIDLIAAPTAALALFIAFAAMEPFTALRRGAVELGRTLLAVRRIGPRLAESADTSTLPLPDDGYALQMKHIFAGHNDANHVVLRDISLNLAKGERIAIIGPSGSGKSTLLGMIAGELSTSEGEVATLPATLLTQRTELFHDSLRENLLLADPSASDTKLVDVLQAAGLGPALSNMPEGLDTQLGEGGLGLSGGQARRLALARLLLRDRPFWLLDEPTEGLDAATARDVLNRLRERSQGHAIMIATHIRREAECADRLVLLEQGRIVAMARRGEPLFERALSGLRPDWQ